MSSRLSLFPKGFIRLNFLLLLLAFLNQQIQAQTLKEFSEKLSAVDKAKEKSEEEASPASEEETKDPAPPWGPALIPSGLALALRYILLEKSGWNPVKSEVHKAYESALAHNEGLARKYAGILQEIEEIEKASTEIRALGDNIPVEKLDALHLKIDRVGVLLSSADSPPSIVQSWNQLSSRVLSTEVVTSPDFNRFRKDLIPTDIESLKKKAKRSRVIFVAGLAGSILAIRTYQNHRTEEIKKQYLPEHAEKKKTTDDWVDELRKEDEFFSLKLAAELNTALAEVSQQYKEAKLDELEIKENDEENLNLLLRAHVLAIEEVFLESEKDPKKSDKKDDKETEENLDQSNITQVFIEKYLKNVFQTVFQKEISSEVLIELTNAVQISRRT